MLNDYTADSICDHPILLQLTQDYSDHIVFNLDNKENTRMSMSHIYTEPGGLVYQRIRG